MTLSSPLHKITIVGAGYVGMSLAALLAKHNQVVVFDIDKDRVKKINAGISSINDPEIDNLFSSESLNIIGTTDKNIAYKHANIIIIATPTDLDINTNQFDTNAVDIAVDD